MFVASRLFHRRSAARSLRRWHWFTRGRQRTRRSLVCGSGQRDISFSSLPGDDRTSEEHHRGADESEARLVFRNGDLVVAVRRGLPDALRLDVSRQTTARRVISIACRPFLPLVSGLFRHRTRIISSFAFH